MVEVVQSQLTWIGAHSTFPVNKTHKTSGSINMELVILNFGCKSVVQLNTAIDKTIEKCTEFYKGMCLIHHQCQILASTPEQDFPAREQHLKNLQDML